MDLQPYFQRIGYRGTPRPNLGTLRELHRRHLLALSYENLDIHLGRPVELDEKAVFNKLVLQKRGGWCYEMNGLFSRVLREIGFEIRLLAGSVRTEPQPQSTGDHLLLLVELEKPYLADVGFGDGFLEPLPLEEGEYRQDFLVFKLEKKADRWILHNHPAGGAKRYDFTLQPCRIEDFSQKSRELQTSPISNFVQMTVCQRFTPGSILVLRGAVYREISRSGVKESKVETEENYGRLLEEKFGLGLGAGEISRLWAGVIEKHRLWQKSLEQTGSGMKTPVLPQ